MQKALLMGTISWGLPRSPVWTLATLSRVAVSGCRLSGGLPYPILRGLPQGCFIFCGKIQGSIVEAIAPQMIRFINNAVCFYRVGEMILQTLFSRKETY